MILDVFEEILRIKNDKKRKNIEKNNKKRKRQSQQA
jgi:hypothetical protein